MSTLTSFDADKKNLYIRWSLHERVQHWVLVVAFIILVISGFALKYPESWWVRPFTSFSGFMDLRGLLHRVAGGAFILIGFYHIFYLFLTRRGRAMARAFVPGVQDLRDLSQNVAYNFGFSKHQPKFAHFSYMEKAEYLALIWGAIIMNGTGLLLWFDSVTISLFSRWSINLITVVHLYEAWLASLAILVWHLYYVIFNPDIYPLNTSMINGKLTEKEMREEYFLEWQALQNQLKQQQELAQEQPETSRGEVE